MMKTEANKKLGFIEFYRYKFKEYRTENRRMRESLNNFSTNELLKYRQLKVELRYPISVGAILFPFRMFFYIALGVAIAKFIYNINILIYGLEATRIIFNIWFPLLLVALFIDFINIYLNESFNKKIINKIVKERRIKK